MKFQKQIFTDLGETLYFGTSAKGLPVYIFKKPGYTESYAIFATHFGSINRQIAFEEGQKPTILPDGIAHFLEHKMFEEPDGTDVFERFSKTGASANAYTNFDMTAYLFSCTSDFAKNLRTLLDYVQTPYYTEENVQKEQGIIGQEIRMYDDDPEWVSYFNCLQAMYHRHPVRIDIAGTIESISEITPSLLYQCHSAFYHPGNMALVIAGDVDVEAIGAIVDEEIRTEAKPEVEQFFPQEPCSVRVHEVESHLAISMPMFYIGFKDGEPTSDCKQLLRNRLCATLALQLLVGESSELYQRLYEEGLVNAPLSCEVMAQPTYFCSLISGESEQPKRVRDLVLAEVSALSARSRFQTDFERIKKNVYGSFVKSFNRVEHIAGQQLHFLFDGVSMLDYLPTLNAITADEIAQYLKTKFTEDRMVLSVVWPQKEEQA